MDRKQGWPVLYRSHRKGRPTPVANHLHLGYRPLFPTRTVPLAPQAAAIITDDALLLPLARLSLGHDWSLACQCS
jgi:hypothetical protein